MSKVPENLKDSKLSQYLVANGYSRIHQGKVRDTYLIPGNSKKLLVVATDRISIFDFVLNALVPKKGEVLTALTHFWMMNELSEFENHLVTSSYSNFFNSAYDLREELLPELELERCLIVKNMKDKLYPFEMIFRHHIGGSVFKKYQETGMAGGHELPKGLPKWSKLKTPIFTPSTKEEVGHDVNVDANYFFEEMTNKGLGEEAKKVVEIITKIYEKAYAFAEESGILIIDTKLEVAGKTIVDEILTPDSSRFTLKKDWEKAMKEGRDPQFLDKQPVRDWGSTVETPFYKDGNQIIGINKLDPENPEHVNFVHNLIVPEKVINDTTKRYLNLFETITGVRLNEYQEIEMGV